MMNALSYLTNILTLKVYDVTIEFSLQLAPKLYGKLGFKVWLKREDLQPVFSFKIRGAHNMMTKLPRELLEKGVICSAYNLFKRVMYSSNCTTHADLATMAFAQYLASGFPTPLGLAGFPPVPTVPHRSRSDTGGDDMMNALSYLTNILTLKVYDVTIEFSLQLAPKLYGKLGFKGVVGKGSYLLCGDCYVKRVNPKVRIIGVEPSDANAMALSFHYNQRLILDHVGGFVDGVTVGICI
ncbi:threonine dehydratase biosynthetic, chloroplastic-like [Vigna umbellata]|uniref:threonine dehydratase biosynthetic, chloroplastic-like n=1 Tax=Vigna umbellata TaxID=87088 RepID=UPI001F5E86B1|nr:threonine dehydratase biosynthetic, chloroplastic-like [Vigna umbellata]